MAHAHGTFGRLDGKVALIVGSSTGIGAAIARLLADLGAAVVLASRDVPAMEIVASDIVASHGEATVVKTDVAKDGDVELAVATALAAYGGLDVAVNNAGTQGPALPLAEQPEEEFDRIIDVNLKGAWRSMRAEIPAMLDRGGGAIVNTASVGGLVAAPGIAPYCASKHGLIGLSKATALDYAPVIRVNVVAPGAIDTSMFNEWMSDPRDRQRMTELHPLRRIGQPAEVATAVAWLCSSASSYVTGAVVPIDGGYTIT